MGPVPWEAMKCCHGSLMGINDVFRPQDTLCEVRAEIGSLSQNNSPPLLYAPQLAEPEDEIGVPGTNYPTSYSVIPKTCNK